MKNTNCYEDAKRAAAYARLEFPGTYYLAFRDLPAIISRHAEGDQAIDFGCGTGRSTRFLRNLGFNTVGVDISKTMINQAREIDPEGDYRLINEADLSQFAEQNYDLVLAAFPFDNIPTAEDKRVNLEAISCPLKKNGRIIILVSSPEMYLNEWLSFSTCSFPENREARSGDIVKNLITEIDDKRAVEDYLCLDEDYRNIFAKAHLQLMETYKPLGYQNEPFDWVNETTIPPWVIYILAHQKG